MISNILIAIGLLCLGGWIGSLFHFHRWGKWTRYVTDGSIKQTRQYRICKTKDCQKMEDENVCYNEVKEN